MPRDRRLYMTFPIDFHRHPKLARLSVEARWVFVEMNGEARLAENDGRFAAEEAEFLWSREHLEELVQSHPSRPLVVRTAGEYVIRDYAEHQFTKADRDELSRKRSEAGRAGGKAKASAKQVPSKVKQTEAESESESGLERLTDVSESQSLNTRGNETTDSGYSSKITARLAGQAGIKDPAMLVRLLQERAHVTVAWDHLPAIVNHLVGKSKKPVQSGQAYAVTCILETPEEVAAFIYESGLAA